MSINNYLTKKGNIGWKNVKRQIKMPVKCRSFVMLKKVNLSRLEKILVDYKKNLKIGINVKLKFKNTYRH